MRDVLAEIYASMVNNKTRIALTGFSIGWGLFILIVLLGAGNGLLKGMTRNFSTSGENIVTLTPGKTSINWNGVGKGHPVYLTINDAEIFKRGMDDCVKGVFPIYTSDCKVVYNNFTANVSFEGQTPGWGVVKQMHIAEGRDIDSMDMEQMRKVCIITTGLKQMLFGNEPMPKYAYIDVGNVPFLIVGVCEPDIKTNKAKTLYMPLSTAMLLYERENHLSAICLQTRNLNTEESNIHFVKHIQAVVSSAKGYAPDDRKAVQIENPYEMYVQVKGLLSAINAFIWVIGLATLIAGIVGISNIMLITVRERTRELGVRKAMGASNESIVTLVLLESVFITIIFGYVGMLFGVGLTQLASLILGATGGSSIFDAPTVDFGIIISANVIMIIAGLIAGYIPAKRAINIKLVEALTA